VRKGRSAHRASLSQLRRFGETVSLGKVERSGDHDAVVLQIKRRSALHNIFLGLDLIFELFQAEITIQKDT
jgi:hypothetical protein